MHVGLPIELALPDGSGIFQDLRTEERLLLHVRAKQGREVVADVSDMIAVVGEVQTVRICLRLPHNHLNICQMMPNSGVNAEIDILLVELIVAILHKQAIEYAALRLQGIHTVWAILHSHLLQKGWLVVEAVQCLAKGIVLNIERKLADMIALMGNDAVVYLHPILLCFFQHKDFCIQIAHVADAKLHVGASLYGAPTVVDDGSLTESPQEAVEVLGAVLAGKAVNPQGNLEDGEPLVVGALWHIGLQFVSRKMLFPLTVQTYPRKQIIVLGYEARGVASAQQSEQMQRKQ